MEKLQKRRRKSMWRLQFQETFYWLVSSAPIYSNLPKRHFSNETLQHIFLAINHLELVSSNFAANISSFAKALRNPIGLKRFD